MARMFVNVDTGTIDEISTKAFIVDMSVLDLEEDAVDMTAAELVELCRKHNIEIAPA